MKIICILLPLGILLLLVASRYNNGCKVVKLAESPETKEFLTKNSDLWNDIFGEKGWKLISLKEITQRNTGNLRLPQTDYITGETITLKISLAEKMYGATHVYTLSPAAKPERTILYIHGGAYVFNINGGQVKLCDTLCSKLSAEVIVPLYNLAPQGNYREAYKLLHQIYGELLKKNRPICIMGDSSGGGLALGFVMDLKANSKKLPDKLVLLSPWLDITMSNPENVDYEAKDVMLSQYGLMESGKLWADGDNRSDYHLSPINGDVRNLPPTLITVGTAELFYPDIKLLFQKYENNKLSCTLIEGEGLFHVFPVTSIPEAEKTRNLIFDFIKESV